MHGIDRENNKEFPKNWEYGSGALIEQASFAFPRIARRVLLMEGQFKS